MKPFLFKVAVGSHNDQDGREYKEGEMIESWTDLRQTFANKFTLVREADFTPDAPVQPVRAPIVPVQPVPVPTPVEAVSQAPEGSASPGPGETIQESAPVAEPKKKRKTVNLD